MSDPTDAMSSVPAPVREDEPKRRLHPLSPALHSAKSLAVIIAAISWQGYAQLGLGPWFALVTLLLLGAIALSVVSWFMTGYHVVGRELRVYEGVLWRRSRAIPLERLQSVEVVRPLLAQLTGLAELRLEVVGGAKTEAPLAFLSVRDANHLRERLLALARRPTVPEMLPAPSGGPISAGPIPAGSITALPETTGAPDGGTAAPAEAIPPGATVAPGGPTPGYPGGPAAGPGWPGGAAGWPGVDAGTARAAAPPPGVTGLPGRRAEPGAPGWPPGIAPTQPGTPSAYPGAPQLAPATGYARELHTVNNRDVVVGQLLTPQLWSVPLVLAFVAVQAILEASWSFIGIASTLTAMAGIVLRPARRVLDDWNFRLVRDQAGLRIRHGLLETRNQTVPIERVQVLRAVFPLLWRSQGWLRMRLDVAGVIGTEGQQSGPTDNLLPVGDLDTARRLVTEVLPDVDLAALPVSAPPRQARWLMPLAQPRTGVGLAAHVFAARSGVLTRRLDLVPYARIQSVRVTQRPLQRLLGLATVYADTAAGSVPAPHRELSDARAIAAQLTDRARAARGY